MRKVLATLLGLAFVFFAQDLAAQNAKPVKDEVKVMSVKVSGVCCNGDLSSLKKKLVNFEGIDEVTADNAKKEGTNFKITYHTSLVSEEKIRQMIEKSEGCESGESPYKVKTVSYLSSQK
jgi:copper chaperone CopZ